MEILNIGPQELIFIVALMILFLGPKEMNRLARQTGEMIRRVRRSSSWKAVNRAFQEARDLPVQLVREAGFEEQMAEIRKSGHIAQNVKAASSDIAAQAGEVRSPGNARLRPPQQRGTISNQHLIDRTDKTDAEEPVETNQPAPPGQQSFE